MDTALDPDLVERFRRDLAAVYGEAGVEDFVLGLAISGGADSLALLLLAHSALPGKVEAASVDHGLRDGSAGEAGMVARLCEALDVPHRTLKVEVGTGNIQSKARTARYAALAEWMEVRGLKVLLTAHHADDQAETLMMRLNRGSGLPGLVSIRSEGRVPGASGRVVRPLLGWRKAELESVCRSAGVEWASDPSNEDMSFDRVRMRQALAGADWIDPLALAQSARLLAEANVALDRVVSETHSERVEPDGSGYRFRANRADYVGIEVVRRIFDDMGARPPRSEIARLVERLSAGENASLAGVLATPSHPLSHSSEGSPPAKWHFQPEPPRRRS